MDLGGAWRAAVADDELRRSYHEPGFDDAGWQTLTVPGHWRSDPAFAQTDGPLVTRRAFDAVAPPPGRRAWLVFDGIFYQGDVWLDGGYLGDTEGYFFPHSFEVTDALRARSEHSLAVEVTCAPQDDKTAKRNITGVFQHWDCIDSTWNPGGIWRGVRIDETGPVRITRLRVLCREATETRAVVALRAVLDSDDSRTIRLRTTIGDVDHETDQPLAAGENLIEWTVTIQQPSLWWPRALGAPTLHDVRVEVRLSGDDGAATSDARRLRTGLRRVQLRSWICSVNGERLFLKGSNQGPTRMALAEASPDDLRRDVELAIDAGLDLLRLHAHVTRPELYDAADEAGLLLWQDFPLQWGYARGIRKQAVRQAREAIDLLGHHPSIAIWCGHNEPLAIENEPDTWADPDKLRRMAARAAMAMELPTWNKTVLDRSVKKAFEKGDGTRPVIAHSGVLPHPPQLDGTDAHLYFGWYWGDERDLPGFLRVMPRMARFVTEFGAQAVPATHDFCEPERWPDLDWDRLARVHALQKARFDEYAPPADFTTFDAWREATQAYQATLIRHHVETLRRLKYRPAGGFAQFCFADGHPSVTWSVLGHDRRPKPGYDALREACRPVIVVADRMPASVEPGQALALDVHVVSDERQEIDDAMVTARLAWPGGEHAWRWGGAIPADTCVRVGTVQALAPTRPGPLSLELELRYRDELVASRSESAVVVAEAARPAN
jgi:beta-mannosidase